MTDEVKTDQGSPKSDSEVVKPSPEVKQPVEKPAEVKEPVKETPAPPAEKPVEEKPKDEVNVDRVEEPQTKESVETKYDLKLSEGSALDTGVVERVAEFAKANKFTQEQASAVLAQAEADTKIYAKQLEERSNNWIKAAESDKELGGVKLKENSELARRALDSFGTESLVKELKDSGYGNHPEVLRLLARVGRALSEDKLVKSGGSFQTRKPTHEVFYGETPA